MNAAMHVLTDLRPGDKAALLAALARYASAQTLLDAGSLGKLLLAREALGSTGVGHGIALPHARPPGLAASFCAFARLRKPIAYDAIDGTPVDLAFLLLSPADDNDGHLAALAAVSRRLRDRAVAQAIRDAKTDDTIAALLAG